MTSRIHVVPSPSQQQPLAYDPLLDDVGYMTCMTLVLLGNYAQTGHLGGPLAYTPYNVAAHLIGPENGGLRFDYRRPKHPYSDKFMMAAGHSVPTCYALWMIMGQALYRKYQQTGDPRYRVDPHVAMLPIDALGFRRGAGALKTLLHETDLEDHPLFAQAKGRGIRALAGHAESTDCHQRRERRTLGHRHRDGRGQSGVLGYSGRARVAESDRAGRRIRAHRRSRAGVEDAGARAASGKAFAGDGFRQQRGHRRLPDWRRLAA